MEKLQELMTRIYSGKHFNLVAFGVIAAMVLIAYANTFTASFHFDDNPSIIENAQIRHVTGENILKLITGNRPVVYLSIMLNYQLSGLNVVGWHIFNIGVHIINSIFVYLLVLWTLTLPAFGTTFTDKAKRMALFCALLFGVHPIQTESVTYIISRSELLATCFYLATFLLFIKGAPGGRFVYVIGMFITSLLSMGSKEWAVTLPALLLLYDYLFIAEGKFKPLLSRWFLYLLVALPWVTVLKNLDLTSKGGSAGVGFNLVSNTGITPWTYLLTSLNVIWTYVRLLFLPINQNLDYDYPVAKTLFELPTILSFLGHVVVIAGTFWLFWKKGWKLIPFGVAWFYIGLSPSQSFVPVVDVIFEHRLYMPSIGFFMVFLAFYEMLFDWFGERRAKQAVAGAS
jgi:protein O-mannosyl-transferase